jgi:hypothetical protein
MILRSLGQSLLALPPPHQAPLLFPPVGSVVTMPGHGDDRRTLPPLQW